MEALASARWTGWDGSRLHWAGTECGELCIDGVRFEPVAAGEGMREFALSPSGNAQIEFALRDGGRALAPPWRVLFGRAAALGAQAWDGPPPVLRPLRAADAAWPCAPRPVAIVVPIYNSPQCVQRCILAVRRWTRAPARLILIDDASTDPAIGVLLAPFAHTANVVVRRNEHNLGYTRSSNLGIELAGDDDVVLLNSDTEVGPCWLETLQRAAYAAADIGTATAVSDNAGAFSVPELERYCPIPARWDLPQTQRALLHHAGGCRPELPTGNGFCMYVKRALLARVGAYDAEAFPFGYGEENDLCQRAIRAGFRHVIAGDVFVRHARSASFGDERRAALGVQGMAALRARYPNYEADVGATLFGFARRVLDYRVRRLYDGVDPVHAAGAPRPRVLLAGAAAALAASLQASHECLAIDIAGTRFALRCLDHGDACLAAAEGDAAAAPLAAALQANAIETVHLHGDVPPLLLDAVRLAGIALADTRADAAWLGDTTARENPFIGGRCVRLYASAWRRQCAFPDAVPGAA